MKLYEIGFYIRFVRKSAFREFIEEMAQAKKSYLASPLVDAIADWTSSKQ